MFTPRKIRHILTLPDAIISVLRLFVPPLCHRTLYDPSRHRRLDESLPLYQCWNG